MAFRNYILVCGGTACESSKAGAIYDALVAECRAQGVSQDVQVVKTGCFGFCEQGPIVKVLPEDSFYVQVKPEDAKEIVSEHIVKGREVRRLLYDKDSSKKHAKVEDIKFYQKQFRIVLRNCGFIDPENIDEYIAREGYVALEKTLFDMTPDDVINELKIAGLRGRGGAGFPTWMKWNFTKQVEADEKYIVCNADEGDPGAYMDRSTLEGDPHSVLEAMTIAGHTVGARQGFIYIRAEYPLAIHRLEVAMKQSREYGLLGKNILGSGFDFDIEIRLGAGAFVCGEETALLASIEGRRGMPVPRPPFPAVRGLWGKPTVINNVETWANIPVIILKGGPWFERIGTPDSHGTKVFALTGKIRNSGLVEVPMGTTLREIIYDVGGGIAHDKEFKAVQTGGPSGGVITKDYLDTPIDFGSLTKLGSMMGSGGMIVMDEDDCIVDVAKFYLNFTVDESCGKCAPCRIGGRSLANILDKITKGNGTLEDLDKMEEIGGAMKKASLCALGQTAPNPILSTVYYFKDEYLAHIVEKRCPAGKCKSLITYSINTEKCIGCTACARKCPVQAITGERRAPHTIDPALCIKCGICLETCKFGAVEVR
ncbi:MAG: NADH-quinone oxidoreductase subunit NuoF [Sphaerochaetaceae bacterium]|jgi:NADH:ubiquinone oxidoreductase subunit F (NADH-binding)/(2Fe-2S) ferredoxin/Pyruvate/2-oxoacid:ferredoxin oxidoreductase delta subunit|nr:NADH-quinone oxidoreductase subunit NuoF [Sphaerochaetaceae bacterium]NLO60752.1 NADH-quinone oxidoreductase subunit NuoF [Spirochaetales bacterium]MDD2406087.1 NADH-quinone oxidoreductase subunit NuoF [Sphaerochaetaceae bacterium]MDD3670085.1 NADH-quinone oxidoreductase subunit NuoF [Sphaerochaetaceae bacterium]MDD4260253.1 NADH-quinone oxidoreductase subunit NuoF [Sphaerochaetaceae bacterium]